MARAALLSALAFLLAAVIVYPLAVLGGVLAGELLGVSQREGAFAMFIGSTIAPLIAVAAGIVAAIFTGRRVSAPVRHPQTRRRVTIWRLIGMAGGGVAGYAAGWALRWLLFEGQSFSNYWQAYMASLMPELAALAGIAIGFAVAKVAVRSTLTDN
jgi:hypothetical protein